MAKWVRVVTLATWLLCCSCAGDPAAKPADGSGGRTRNHPGVRHHGLPAGSQLLAEGRTSGDQFVQVPRRRVWRGRQHGRTESTHSRHWTSRLRRVHVCSGQCPRTRPGNHVPLRYVCRFAYHARSFLLTPSKHVYFFCFFFYCTALYFYCVVFRRIMSCLLAAVMINKNLGINA